MPAQACLKSDWATLATWAGLDLLRSDQNSSHHHQTSPISNAQSLFFNTSTIKHNSPPNYLLILNDFNTVQQSPCVSSCYHYSLYCSWIIQYLYVLISLHFLSLSFLPEFCYFEMCLAFLFPLCFPYFFLFLVISVICFIALTLTCEIQHFINLNAIILSLSFYRGNPTHEMANAIKGGTLSSWSLGILH